MKCVSVRLSALELEIILRAFDCAAEDLETTYEDDDGNIPVEVQERIERVNRKLQAAAKEAGDE